MQESRMKPILAFVCLFAVTPVLAQRTYVIQNWPDDVEKLPCDAWKKEPDGVWTQVATIVVSSRGITIGRNSFGLGAAESALVERKCGAAH
jgi:hypothetical protein